MEMTVHVLVVDGERLQEACPPIWIKKGDITMKVEGLKTRHIHLFWILNTNHA